MNQKISKNRKLKIVGCHQPNFLPWLGFFSKMANVDTFILLDDVQFTLGGRHNWTTRVRMINKNKPFWLSMPVERSGKGLQKINDLKTDSNNPIWLKKMIKSIEHSYSNTPYYSTVIPPVIDALQKHSGSIFSTNLSLIEIIRTMLKLNTKIVLSSELNSDGLSTERIIDLVKSISGDCYLSGDGADDYQEIEKFKTSGIHFRKLGFQHPIYKQRLNDDFVSGLTILDPLCNVGIEKTLDLINSAVKEEGS